MYFTHLLLLVLLEVQVALLEVEVELLEDLHQ